MCSVGDFKIEWFEGGWGGGVERRTCTLGGQQENYTHVNFLFSLCMYSRNSWKHKDGEKTLNTNCLNINLKINCADNTELRNPDKFFYAIKCQWKKQMEKITQGVRKEMD